MAIFKESKVKSSLLVTLTLVLLFIGVFPLLVSNWRIIATNRDALESNLQESFVTTVTNVASQIGVFVNSYRSQIRDYAPKAVVSLRDTANWTGGEPPALMRDANIMKVRILNPQGNGPYATKSNFSDPTVTDLEYEAFQQAIQGKSYVGKPYYDVADDMVVLLLAEPLRNDDDKVIGALSVVVNLSPLVQMITEQSSRGASGTKVYVIDSKGNLLLHPQKSMMQSHPNLSSSAIIQDYQNAKVPLPTVRRYKEKGVEILGSYSSVSDLNWGVIIQIEEDIAFASVNSMIRQSTMWGILFAMAAAVTGFLLARWITTPIQVLAQHALDVGRHQNFDKKIEIKAGNEIEQLANTFNYMTDEIKQNILSLKAAARENKELFFSSIRMLSAAIDAKDPYTRGHSERVKDYSLIIGKQLGLKANELERLEIAALLHDVGKIGIEDRILRKPTNLTPEEFEIMKTHPDKGANIMAAVAQLADIIPGMRSHHENFDGSGYPQGLKGEGIPFFGRVITVADTFDAMTTDRPYQKAFTLEFALNRIKSMSGIKYDPKVVEAFARACEEGRVSLHKPSRPRPKQPVV